MNSSDNDIRQWAQMASRRGGSFVQAIGEAILHADDSNFALLRAVEVQLIGKYPEYLTWAQKEAERLRPGEVADC